MTDKQEYKEAMSRLDKDTRVCIKHLEGLMEEKFRLALKIKQPPIPKVDFSKLESKDDSLQKQINGMRKKVKVAYSFTKEYVNAEIFLKNLNTKADEVLSEVRQLFDELYASGFIKKEEKRRRQSLK